MENNDRKLYEDVQLADERSPVAGSPGRCFRCCELFQQSFKPCLTKYNDAPSKEHGACRRAHYALMCPPHGRLSEYLTTVLLVVLAWGLMWSITGEESLPGGNLFAIYVLCVCCMIGGVLVDLIKLPPLFGMLVVGLMLRNIPVINVAKDIDPAWASALRNMALGVILLRAGLGLDSRALKQLKYVCLRLAFLPCIFECITAAIVSHFLLGFPWEYGFLMGFVLAAVSPAVVVPSLLVLQDQGYGVDQGIPTLVIAAASIDDVLAISGFGVVLGITFSTGSIAVNLIMGPVELIMGLAMGCVLGVLLWYLPSSIDPQKDLVQNRFLLLFGLGLFTLFGSRAAGFAGAGALACLSVAFFAAQRWKSQKEPVGVIIAFLWTFFQPLLFGLIGAEIDVTTLDGSTIGLGVAMLAISLTVRIAVSFSAVFGAGLTRREQLFVAIAWLPKATVQAAIGSIALDTAREREAGDDQILYGMQILTIAVLVILITAPFGAAAIAVSGPRLLQKSANLSKYNEAASADGVVASSRDENDADPAVPDESKSMLDGHHLPRHHKQTEV